MSGFSLDFSSQPVSFHHPPPGEKVTGHPPSFTVYHLPPKSPPPIVLSIPCRYPPHDRYVSLIGHVSRTPSSVLPRTTQSSCRPSDLPPTLGPPLLLDFSLSTVPGTHGSTPETKMDLTPCRPRPETRSSHQLTESTRVRERPTSTLVCHPRPYPRPSSPSSPTSDPVPHPSPPSSQILPR